ncbi:StbD Antitoxin of toxin-antitoxin stability system [Methylophilaceae bacterium]
MAITQNIYAQSTVSMTDLRRASIADIVSDSPVAVLNHNKPAAYLLSADYYEFLLDQVENIELSKIVKERRGGKTVKVSLDDLQP